jgi:hypothetical protein
MVYRPDIPLRTQRAVRERADGICECGCRQPLGARSDIDHHPALGLRRFDAATRTYTPDANDPEFLQVLRHDCHAIKTGGNQATSAGSDAHAMAKARRIADKRNAKPPTKMRSRNRLQSRAFRA